MKELKLRTKYLENIGYFSQVKDGIFPWSWKTIGKHNTGFGLYPNNHIDYPMKTIKQAKHRCYAYCAFLGNLRKPTYRTLEVEVEQLI